MTHLSHKTADAILDRNWKESPVLTLYNSGPPSISEQFTSIARYVTSAAREQGVRLRISVRPGRVQITREVPRATA